MAFGRVVCWPAFLRRSWLTHVRRDLQTWMSSFRCVTVDNVMEWFMLHVVICYCISIHGSSHTGFPRILECPWMYFNFPPKFKALKVLEKSTGAWKSLNFVPQVLEFTTRSNCAITKFTKRCCPQVSCLHGLQICQVFCLKKHLLMFYYAITVPSSQKYTLNIAVLLHML